MFIFKQEIQTPGIDGDGPRMKRVIFAAANASVDEIRFERVAKLDDNDIVHLSFSCLDLPSLGVMVAGTGISCVALILVRPGRPSNAGSRN